MHIGRVTRHFHEKAGAVNIFCRAPEAEMFPPEAPVAGRTLPERSGAGTQDYIRLYNKNPRPFQWVASASKISRKVSKYKGISDTGD